MEGQTDIEACIVSEVNNQNINVYESKQNFKYICWKTALYRIMLMDILDYRVASLIILYFLSQESVYQKSDQSDY